MLHGNIKSFTAKDAEAKGTGKPYRQGRESAEERKSFTAKGAEDAKDRSSKGKGAETTPSQLLDALREILIPRAFPFATRGALGSSFARGAVDDVIAVH